MATMTVTLTGTGEWFGGLFKLDTEYVDEDNGKGGNWNFLFTPDADSVKVFNALGAKMKMKDGKLRLRRYEKHPKLGDLGPPTVTGAPEGEIIGNGSEVEVKIDVYDYEFKGRAGRGVRLADVHITKLVEYQKPDAAKPAVGVPAH